MKRHNRQIGQAMTEFLITASAVLIPLFIAYPMLAKYIDMRHAAVQAARYEAWEYTVWYNPADDNDILDNFSAVTIPAKTPAEVQAETRQRFFSNASETGTLPITGNDKSADWDTTTRNRFWDNTIHRVPLYQDGGYTSDAALVSSAATPTLPILGTVMNTLMDIVGFAFEAVGTVLGVLGSSAGFSAINTEGYSTSTVAIDVDRLNYFGDPSVTFGDDITGTTPVTIQASASVLGDGWNAGGKEHASNQVQGTIPTTLLKTLFDTSTAPGSVLGPVWDVVSILAPELSRCFSPSSPPTNPLLEGMLNAMDRPNGSLWFGHIDFDAVHPDRLASGGNHVCDDAGVCAFENPTPPEALVCIP